MTDGSDPSAATPLGLDLRLDRALSAADRAPAATWSFWPDAPFGASADPGVWPSVFVPRPPVGTPPADRIPLAPGAFRYWQATGLWDDIAEMTAATLPLPVPTEAIALGLIGDPAMPPAPDRLLGQLVRTGITDQSRDLPAAFLGHDIVDLDLRSALFDAPAPEGVEAGQVGRSAAGLIAGTDDARALLPVLEAADPAHGPLFVVGVWSLGQRPATPGASE